MVKKGGNDGIEKSGQSVLDKESSGLGSRRGFSC